MWEVMDVLINWMKGIFSQCVCVYQIITLYTFLYNLYTILFLSYTSISLGRGNQQTLSGAFSCDGDRGIERIQEHILCEAFLGGP